MIRRPPRSTRTATLFPYTTLFRSQNLSLEMLARIGSALDSEIVALGAGGPTHLRVTGPTTLSGTIDVKSSKNAGVALLCASLPNKGRTTLRKVARLEAVNRLLEVLERNGEIGSASCRERVSQYV